MYAQMIKSTGQGVKSLDEQYLVVQRPDVYVFALYRLHAEAHAGHLAVLDEQSRPGFRHPRHYVDVAYQCRSRPQRKVSQSV